MNNAITTLERGLIHHDFPMVRRAAAELISQNDRLTSENVALLMENADRKRQIRDHQTELDLCCERMARPVTLIIAPEIGLWLAGLPTTLADAVQVACDWIDRQMERVPETVTVPARLAVGMAALMAIVCAGMMMGFEAVAGGF